MESPFDEQYSKDRNKKPLIVEESLSFLKSIALSLEDLKYPNPTFGMEANPVTPVQERALVDITSNIRSQTILRGNKVKIENGKTVYSMQIGNYLLYSSSPQDEKSITKGKLFTLDFLGDFEDDPQISFTYYKARGREKDDSVELIVKFPNPDKDIKEAVYDTKRFTNEFERPDYEVATFYLTSALKLIEENK